MPLALAIKNRTAVVVASDTAGSSTEPNDYGPFMPLSDRAIMMIVGNLDVVRTPITSILTRVGHDTPPAHIAEIVQAELTVAIVPHIDQLKGRVEIIVAGLDPIRHIEEPSLYYMDSARNFHLELSTADALAAGATAAVTALTAGHSYADASIDHLKLLAKECLSATKMRWPTALKNYVSLAVITSGGIQVQEY